MWRMSLLKRLRLIARSLALSKIGLERVNDNQWICKANAEEDELEDVGAGLALQRNNLLEKTWGLENNLTRDLSDS